MPNITTVNTRLPMPEEAGVTPATWRVLTEAIFPSAKTPEAIVLALSYCKARGYDVMKRPVHIVPMWNSELRKEVETVWPGINSLNTEAARSGAWAGMDPPVFGPEVEQTFAANARGGDSKTVTVRFPQWAERTVYRLVQGQRVAFTERVYWLESYGRWKGTEVPNEMWARRPHGQLAKCATAAVLRLAFPEAADYSAEEMEGRTIDAGGADIEQRAVNARDITPAPSPRAEAEAALAQAAAINADTGEILEGPEPEMQRFVKIFDEAGALVATTNVWETALKSYGEVKRRASDKAFAAENNLPALLTIQAHLGKGTRPKLDAEIAAIQAMLEPREPEIDEGEAA